MVVKGVSFLVYTFITHGPLQTSFRETSSLPLVKTIIEHHQHQHSLSKPSANVQ